MTPLILLPGMMCDERLFTHQINAFSRHRDVCVAPIHNHSTMAQLAAEILQSAPPKFALAGLSMGGIVAMEIYSQAPHRIERLALMDTNALAETDEVKLAREPQIKKVMEGRLREVMRDEMKPRYLAQTPQKQSILDICMDMAMDLGPEVFVRQSNALRDRGDQCRTLGNLDIPTLVLCGAQDTLCPLERHRLMHHLIGGSTLTVIDNAGHLPTLEQPEHTTKALKTWLKN